LVLDLINVLATDTNMGFLSKINIILFPVTYHDVAVTYVTS